MKEVRVILNRLLDKYENSKHLFQPGISARRVMLRIDRKELPEYDYQDPSVRDAYNAAAVELERQSLVRLEWSRESPVLSIIALNLESIMECYGQAGRVHPRVEAERFSALAEARLAGISVPWIAAWRDAVCAEARERWKVPSFCKEGGSLLPNLLEAFCRYAELSDSVTMRAFSSQCFHDTKYFERNVREGFLRIARRYNADLAAACEEGELSERDQLAFLGIYASPELYELAGILYDPNALRRDFSWHGGALRSGPSQHDGGGDHGCGFNGYPPDYLHREQDQLRRIPAVGKAAGGAGGVPRRLSQPAKAKAVRENRGGGGECGTAFLGGHRPGRILHV